jgi:hypothetical protein
VFAGVGFGLRADGDGAFAAADGGEHGGDLGGRGENFVVAGESGDGGVVSVFFCIGWD